jgi:hypothetical protein
VHRLRFQRESQIYAKSKGNSFCKQGKQPILDDTEKNRLKSHFFLEQVQVQFCFRQTRKRPLFLLIEFNERGGMGNSIGSENGGEHLKIG